ncbi:hypothetical protein [Arthrobacter zhaoxinii]|uniref:hypothetical protein n=1 Tax=Arthrobacter zhaoxinii TaxID=2964616 RepID=UPI0021064BEC|nr:hypothetical protein [Arthrobacter zhaoxinii]MCQ1999983.1 hypothetical protein [Arthrobacter zhaoxinii]
MQKKMAAAVLAAGMLGTSACSDSRMSTEETCQEISDLVLASPLTWEPETLYEGFKPIEARASRELRKPTKAVLDYLEAAAKNESDMERMSELEAGFDEAEAQIDEVCIK